MSGEQYRLPLAIPVPGRSPSASRVWLLAAEAEDSNAIRRTLGSPNRDRAFRHCFLSVENGRRSIQGSDWVLLRSGKGALDVFVPQDTSEPGDSLLQKLSDALEATALVRPASIQTSEIAFLQFSGLGRRSARRRRSIYALQRVFESLHCRSIATNPHLVARLTQEILIDTPAEADPVLIGLLKRVRADALLRMGPVTREELHAVSELIELYRGAASSFQECRFTNQANECFRRSRWVTRWLDASQYWLPGIDNRPFNSGHISPSGLGFVMRRCIGVPLEIRSSIENWPTDSGNVRAEHEWIGRLDISDGALVRCLTGTRSEAVRPYATLCRADSSDTRVVRVSLDYEHAAMLGLAGKLRSASEEAGSYFISVSTTAGELSPAAAAICPGQSRDFAIKLQKSGSHRVNVIVVSSVGTAQSASLSFHV